MTLSRLLFPAALALLASLFVSCDDAEREPVVPQGDAEVWIGIPETRTVLDADGLSTRWEKGDRFVLWACAADGSQSVSGAAFSYYGSKADGVSAALFRGVVPAMADGTYTYYAASPVPAAIDGLRVGYDLPAVQDGEWHGDYDILLAQAQGDPLRVPAADAIDDVNALDLRFRHKIHALKVTVPEGRNRFGRPITRLRVQFPVPVAGRLTWDLAAADADAAMEATSDAVTLEFARPKGEGDTFWIYIAPCDLTGATVRFTATDGKEFSWPIETAAFRDCRAGEITTVTLTLPELRPMSDYRIAVDPSQLGETVTEIDAVELPEGYSFPSLDLALRRAEHLPSNGDGTFSMRIFSDMSADFPAEVGMTVGSASATGVAGRLGTGQCTVSGVTASGCTIKAPYLFYEDFGGVINNNTQSDNNNGTMMDAGNLLGWSGSRWETVQDNSGYLRLHTYIGTTTSNLDNKWGRGDTPSMSCLKSSVSLRISYRVGGSKSDGLFGTQLRSKCVFGTHNDASAVGGGTGGGARPDNVVDSYDTETNGYATMTEHSHVVSSCGRTTRFSWFLDYSKSGAPAARSVQLYLDDIRVTIVQ